MLFLALDGHGQECNVHLSVGAFDRDFHKVSRLDAGDFELRAGDTPLSINSITSSSAPRFFIVLDASPSVKKSKDGYWRYSKAIATRLIANAPAESDIGLVMLGLGPIVRIAPTRDLAALARFIAEFGEEEIDTPAKTPLWDAVGHAVSALRPTKPGDFVVIITDGFGNEGKLTLERIPKLLQPDAIRLFPLLLTAKDTPFDEPNTLTELITQQMNSLANATGGYGRVVEISRIPKKLDAEVQKFADDVARNTLEVALGYHHLELTIPAELAGEKVKIKLPKRVDKRYTMIQSRLPECGNALRPATVR